MLLNHKKQIMLAISFLFAVCLFTGCDQTKETCSVKIEDCNVETQLDTDKNETVKEALADAEIVLGKQDQITPSLSEKITKDTKIEIKRHATVTLTADKKQYDVEMTGGRVSDALKKADVTLSEKDVINHDQKAYLTDGMDIDVVRMVSVKFTADGKTKEILTDATTVKELLKKENVKVGKDDRLSMGKSDKLKDGSTLTLKRVTYKTETRTESIPYSTTTRKDSSMKKGHTKVVRSGINGQKKVTYKVIYVDGKEESRKVISSKTVKSPVNKIVKSGTKAGKRIVRKWKEVDCDGTVIWHYVYSDGTRRTVVR